MRGKYRGLYYLIVREYPLYEGTIKAFEQIQRYLEIYYLALKLSNLDLRAILRDLMPIVAP